MMDGSPLLTHSLAPMITLPMMDGPPLSTLLAPMITLPMMDGSPLHTPLALMITLPMTDGLPLPTIVLHLPPLLRLITTTVDTVASLARAAAVAATHLRVVTRLSQKK